MVENNVLSVFGLYRYIKPNGDITLRAVYSEGYLSSKCYNMSQGNLVTLCNILRQHKLKMRIADYGGKPNVLLNNFNNAPVFPQDLDISGCFYKKTVRTFKEFAPILKACMPTLNINPIKVTGKFSFDSGFISYGDNLLCTYNPQFAEKMDESNTSIVDGIIFHYHGDKRVYILTDQSCRHKPVTLYEDLFINLNTGQITARYSDIKNGVYFITNEVFNGNFWNTESSKGVPIDGYKEA